MILIDKIKVGNKELLGVKIDLPKAPLLLLSYKDILIGCGYFSKETLEKLDIPGCIVSGVSNFNEMLEAKIKYVTSKARLRGAKEGMKVIEFLKAL